MSITKPSAPMLPPMQDDRVTGKKLAGISTVVDYDIPYAMTEISLFRKKIYIPTNGVAYVTWFVDFEHRGISDGSTTQYPVGLAGTAMYRRALTEGGLTGAFSYIAKTTGAGQVLGRDHHYTTCGRSRIPFAVEGGYWYEMSLALTAHTDSGSMNGVDGAAQVCPNGGSNFILWEYEPGMTFDFT